MKESRAVANTDWPLAVCPCCRIFFKYRTVAKLDKSSTVGNAIKNDIPKHIKTQSLNLHDSGSEKPAKARTSFAGNARIAASRLNVDLDLISLLIPTFIDGE